MTSHALERPTSCLHCGYPAKVLMGSGGQGSPKPGGVTICIECGEWSVIDKAGDLRRPTDDELIRIGSDPGARAARTAWVCMDRDRKRRSAGAGPS